MENENKLFTAPDPLLSQAKGKTLEEFVKGQGTPKYQHRMLRDTAESDLVGIQKDGFDSKHIEAFNKPLKPFEAKFSKQPNVNRTNMERGNYLATKKGETVLLPPEEWIVAGKNGDFIKPGWKPTEAQVVKIEYDGQKVEEALRNKLTDIWNKGQTSNPDPLASLLESATKEFEGEFMNNGVKGVLADEFQDEIMLLIKSFLASKLTEAFYKGKEIS